MNRQHLICLQLSAFKSLRKVLRHILEDEETEDFQVQIWWQGNCSVKEVTEKGIGFIDEEQIDF